MGWAGRHTEYSTKYVRAHIRTLQLTGDSSVVVAHTCLSVEIGNKDKLAAFVAMLHVRLSENIKMQLARENKVSVETQTDGDGDDPVDWESVVRTVLVRVMQFVHRAQKERAADQDAWVMRNKGVLPPLQTDL